MEPVRRRTPEEKETPKFMKWMINNRPIVPTDELEQYLAERLLVGSIDLIAWWRDQRVRLPTLTRMAMSVFAIPSMSSEPERVFSSTKHLISDKRASLGPEAIEWLECVKHWMKADLYTNEDVATLMALIDEA